MILEHLERVGTLKAYSIGKELHKDEGVHYHAWFSMKIDSNDGRLFDIKGVHPNFVLGNDNKQTIRRTE